jgi:hypothetical protein
LDGVAILEAIHPTLYRRLDTCTKGILELLPSGSVEFIHRCAKDWMLDPDIWEDICSMVPQGYEPRLEILKAANKSILQFDGAAYGDAKDDEYFFNQNCWARIAAFLTLASQVPDSSQTNAQLIRELDRMNELFSKGRISPTEFTSRHWVSDIFFDGGWTCQHAVRAVRYSFVGLTAQFGIHTYVVAKVLEHKELIQRSRWILRPSLLESTIFGWHPEYIQTLSDLGHGNTDGNPFWVRRYAISENVSNHWKQLTQDNRYNLIKFLLDAGDSPWSEVHLDFTSTHGDLLSSVSKVALPDAYQFKYPSGRRRRTIRPGQDRNIYRNACTLCNLVTFGGEERLQNMFSDHLRTKTFRHSSWKERRLRVSSLGFWCHFFMGWNRDILLS